MVDHQPGDEPRGEIGQIDYNTASVREALQGSIKEIETRKASIPAEDSAGKKAEKKPDERESGTRERDEAGKFKPQDPAIDKVGDGADTKPSQTTTQEATTSEQPPAATTAHAAPTTWSKEKHALWAGLPPEAQDYILTRERQSQEGVQQLKNGYAQIDAAIHPYKDLIRSYGQDPGTTIRQLFEWNTALAGPHKELVFAQLAQRFGVDLSRIAPQRQPVPGGAPQGAQDPFAPVFQQLQSWQQNIEAQLQQQTQQQQLREVKKAEAEVQAWAKDKPHFERVRLTMKELVGVDDQLIRTGQLARFGIVRPDGSVDLDRAYQRAIALDDELAGQVEAEKQAKLAAEIQAKAAADAKAKAEAELVKKAKDDEEASNKKRAGASLRPRAAGGPIGRTGNASSHGESVRDTLRRTIKETAGS